MAVPVEILEAKQDVPAPQPPAQRDNFGIKLLKKFNAARGYLFWGLGALVTLGVVVYVATHRGSAENNPAPPSPPSPPPTPPTPPTCPPDCPTPPTPPQPPSWHGPTDLFQNFSDLEAALKDLELSPECENFVAEPTAAVGTFRNYLNRFGGALNSYMLDYQNPSGISEVLEGDPATNAPTTFYDYDCDLDSGFSDVVQWFENEPDPVETLLNTDPAELTGPYNQITYGFHAFQRSLDPNLPAIIHLAAVNGSVQERVTLNPDPDDDAPLTYSRDLATNETRLTQERRSMSAFQAGLSPGQTGVVMEARSTDPQDRRVCGNIFSRFRWWG